MSQSIAVGAVQPDGNVVHKRSGAKVSIKKDGTQVVHRLEEQGLVAEYPVAYTVGAGAVGYSYLVRDGPYLFQSPISYYTQTKSYDLTPGYETERLLDFTHPIPEGCLFCHTGSTNLIRGTTNGYGEPAFTPISCERCHGLSERHLTKPEPGSIVNPAKLAERARASVCEQCHLEGETRVLHPGKTWTDFQAGLELESTFTTYLRNASVSDTSLRAVSQSEQLAQSKCARSSQGKLWCGTCHNPHEEAEDRPKQIRSICLSCHASLFESAKHQPAAECISCHMPRLRPTNVAHSAITDHRIPRVKAEQQQENTSEQPGEDWRLHAWRPPAGSLAQRDLGVAYYELGVVEHNSKEVLEAYELLSHLTVSERSKDPETLADLGSILLQEKQSDLALRLFAEAIALEPNNARLAYSHALALEQKGDLPAAIKELKRSIQLDPAIPKPYLRLAQIYDHLGQRALRAQILADYLKIAPMNLEFRGGSVTVTP